MLPDLFKYVNSHSVRRQIGQDFHHLNFEVREVMFLLILSTFKNGRLHISKQCKMVSKKERMMAKLNIHTLYL